MSEIRKGDLVIVIHTCCSAIRVLGIPFKVAWMELRETYCPDCRTANSCLHAAAREGVGGIPISWLKKIDPPADPETVEHDQEVTAC